MSSGEQKPEDERAQGWVVPPQLRTLLPQRLLLLSLNLTADGESAGVSVRDQRGAARELMRMLALNASRSGDKPVPPSTPVPESPAGERLATLPILVGTLREVAGFFGVSPETVKDWREKGMPGEPGGPGQAGRYDLAEILRWRDATIGPSGRDEPGETSRREADRRKALAAAEKLELEVQELKGELINVATVIREFTHANTHARALLEQGPHRLLGLLPAGATGDDKRRFLREAEKWIAGVIQALHDGTLGRAVEPGASSEQEG